MNRILSILLPPVAVLLLRRPASAVLNLALTACGWAPGVIHAWALVSDDNKIKEAKAERAQLRRITGRGAERDDGKVIILRGEPVSTFLACLLASLVIGTFVYGDSFKTWGLTKYRKVLERYGENPVATTQPPVASPEVAPTQEAAQLSAPAENPAENVAAKPTSIQSDDRTVAAILRERVNWPAKVALRVPLTIALFDGDERVGEASLVAGQVLNATSLTDSGLLSLKIGQQSVEIDMQDTDFVARATAKKAGESTPIKSQPDMADLMSNANIANAQNQQTIERRLLALKGRFPPKYRTSVVSVVKDRNINASNIRRMGAGATQGVEVRTGSSTIASLGHYDSFGFEVPVAEVWSEYKGWVSTATVQGLPVTIQKIRLKVQDDMARYSAEAVSASGGVRRSQCAATVTWLRSTFLPYLKQLEAIAQ